VFTAQGVHFPVYLECVKKSIFLVKSLLIYDSRSILKCSHGTFVTFIHENGVPRGKLQLLGFFHYNFWHKMSTLNENQQWFDQKDRFLQTNSKYTGKCTPCAVNTWNWREKLHHSDLTWGYLPTDKVKIPPPLTRREPLIITGITWNRWFMIQGQPWSVLMAHLWLLFMKMGYQEETYNFWDFSTKIFDIKCRLWMKLVPALVPLVHLTKISCFIFIQMVKRFTIS
jgi:hypothetical protein